VISGQGKRNIWGGEKENQADFCPSGEKHSVLHCGQRTTGNPTPKPDWEKQVPLRPLKKKDPPRERGGQGKVTAHGSKKGPSNEKKGEEQSCKFLRGEIKGTYDQEKKNAGGSKRTRDTQVFTS